VRALDGVGAREPRVPTPTGLRDPAALLAAFPAPTVAVWKGAAIGAGAELLLAADLRVIGPAATMAFPEVGDGELPCWGGTQRLTRAGGVALARVSRCVPPQHGSSPSPTSGDRKSVV